MKNKLLIFVLALFLIGSLCASLMGCGGDTGAACEHNDANTDGKCDSCNTVVGECAHDDQNNDGNCDKCGANVEMSNNELVLVKNGKPTFNFVFSKDISSSVKTLSTTTIKSINKVLATAAADDYETDTNEAEIEIIIGTPNYRGDDCKIDFHYLGPDGYAIKIVGNKLIVLYGSDNAADEALNYLKETVFGITSKTKKLESVVVTEDKLIESKQTFALTSATVVGNDLRDYVIEYPTSVRTAAQGLQDKLYTSVGIWLPKGTASATQKAVIVKTIEHGSEEATENGLLIYVDENANLIIETEFPNKFDEGVGIFLKETILASGNTEYNYTSDYVFNSYDSRNIYYIDFGAKGNGKTDDFEAIKACHEYANEYGHTVNAKPGATYYIGKNEEATSAIVQTNTNWYGCTFIFDDLGVEASSDARKVPIFEVSASIAEYNYNESNAPIKTLEKGATNIGWKPGYACHIILVNHNIKQFIRFGNNADNGASQTEIIIVDKDGNIDPSTPVQWTYVTITSMTVKRIDDAPIVINGGEYNVDAGIDNRTVIRTKHNCAPSEYNYYQRNIRITRSNVILKNIKHEITDFTLAADGGTGAPYSGFISVRYCNNVIVDGIELQNPPDYKVGSSSMGSYELSANSANNVTWQNCIQKDFFSKTGSVTFQGIVGTNYCKNLTFDNMFICSFDAHKGAYNATIKNSTVEHLNFIGEGTIRIENTTIYTDGSHAMAKLRPDYGSTWQGKLIAKNVKLKYSTKNEKYDVSLVYCEWNNHYFGYQTYLPEYIELDNVSLVRYDYGINADGTRWEEEVGVNEKYVILLPGQLTNLTSDITPGGNGGGSNPYIGPECLVIKNCANLNVYYKDTPIFKDMWVYVDGELVREAPSKKEFIPHY